MILFITKIPMRKREFDARVVFFLTNMIFLKRSLKIRKPKSLQRWRLEPKSVEDAQKTRKGELIEPLKPIVYYIDPATPENEKIHQTRN
jgi:hypothetical protein